jgi:hypothetical protein
VNWGSFVIGRKTIKRRMRARLLAIKTELRRTMHDPIAKIGIWIKRMLQGHLNYFAVSGNHPSSRPYGDTAMTHRRGESNRNDLKRSWPHHVALPAEKLRSHVNREVIFCAAGVLSATPLTYSLRHNDSDYVVFCFSKPEDAEAFAKRFDGERLPTGGRR